MTLAEIKALIRADIDKSDTLIRDQLRSDVFLINQIGHHIIHAGGKRLRPLLTLLCARSLEYQGDNHAALGAIIEFIHTATLLHDDVVDHSSLRRGQETANEAFGSTASVLTGDFLYSRAFQMMVNIGEMRVMRVLADATNKIAEGEVMQLLNCNNPDTREADYYNVIYCKTAKLFEAACQLGAIIAGADQQTEQACVTYGKYLGNAFQLADDVLDYTASSAEMGKHIGDDLAEGKPTLPLIYALQHADASERALIARAVREADPELSNDIIDIVKKCGAIDYTLASASEAAEQARNAIAVIPPSEYRRALESLCDLAVSRRH